MPPVPHDSGRTCPACGYNLTGSDSPVCSGCEVTGAETRRAAVERERRVAFDVAMSILAPPGVVLMGSLTAMRWVLARGGGWWWLGLAIVAALFAAMAANDFRVAWRWAYLRNPGAPRTQRIVVAAWFGLCFLGMQGVMIATLGGCLGVWGR